MKERQFELYRLTVDERMADSPHKTALINAIKYKLTSLDQQEASSTHGVNGIVDSAVYSDE
jgi:hypothetical protein